MLVNDFGPVDVDAGLLADSAGQVLRLANGCVCCSLAGGLTKRWRGCWRWIRRRNGS